MSRAEEKRIARQEVTAKRKVLVAATAPLSGKSVGAAAEAPIAIDDQQFRWSAATLDHEFQGAWDWELRGREASDVLTVLEKMGELTWRQVKALKTNSKRATHGLHHSQGVESICPDAQTRLGELHLDLSEVFRLRHGNLVRIWVYMQGATFNVLWFDRSHKVCPSDAD